MSIDPVKIDAVKVLRPDQQEPPLQSSPLPSAGDSGRAPAAAVTLTELPQGRYSDFLRQKEDYGAAAADLREKDQALEKLSQKIGSLKEPLQAIVKQYPPFSPEDKERVEFLKQYAGLRKEIDALTVPRPAPSLPPPPPAVTDRQIHDHLNDLDSAGAAFGQLRGSIASRVPLLAENSASAVLFRAGGGGFSGLSATARDESAAVQKSAEVGQQFAIETARGVSPSNSPFLKSMG
ncbi:hypothetical protein LPW11_09545 [Geomonas sp. RF6]|uniref:hypothetical protein n=1 Tax=Geomonas sp. RF6 TaxID=2897342 RepID=UPI001E4E3D68|nr:hypothetical protein [Geomonas sp. RF6]UFS72420.1 hypothetical protein LPW11_09545 [Geomonas sp. RF6]